MKMKICEHITHTHCVGRGQKSEEVRTINAGEKEKHRERERKRTIEKDKGYK